MENKELASGTTLQSGKYTIERVLGAGGFGITYYARHNTLGNHVAIKEFFISGYCIRNTVRKSVSLQGIDSAVYDKYLQKFIEEAQILAQLDQPNIVKVIDIFQENNTAYIVMPFVEGQTLQQLVEQKGRLDYAITVNYIAQLSEAVDYIHQRNILHRDIKPDNVIITPENKAILIDFGSAREFIQDKTQNLTSIYTQGYAPLEQYSANSRKGSYSDIYSLGATFYFALTGQKPMDAATRMMETMPEPKALISSIPDEANRTIMKAMSLKPEDRQQRIDEFMGDLLNVETPKISISVKSTTEHIFKNGYIPMIIILGIAIFVIGLTTALSYKGQREQLSEKRGKQNEQEIINKSLNIEMIFVQGYDSVNSFNIGKYEVTQAQWQEVMGSNPSFFKGDNLPVESICWDDVQEFIRLLNSSTGKNYRLPTATEWEFAARGGTYGQSFMYSGSNNINDVAWCSENSRNCTHTVGGKRANELGIYDMSGNVWELTQTGKGTLRAIRGGSWDNEDRICRLDYRTNIVNSPNLSDSRLGFRIASDAK